MRVEVVADVGNSRIKWGRCGAAGVDAPVSLPLDDPAAWQRQLQTWGLGRTAWGVGSVRPAACERLVRWLGDAGHAVIVVDSYRKLPLEIAVEAPERVGLDRLFDALAAAERV